MRNRGKILIITCVIIAAVLGLVGCTKTDESTKDVSASAMEAENLPAEDGDVGNGKTSGENPGDGESPAEEDTNEEGGQNAGSSDNSKKDADFPSLHYIPDTEGDLYGDICEVGEKQFTVMEIYTESDDDGSGIMIAVAPGAEDESAEITVVYDDNTAFEKQKIWDGGAGHEEKEGSAADLQKGFSAEMWGSYEGDVFHATAIRVVEVILE